MAVWTGSIKDPRTIGVPVGGGRASAIIVPGSTPPQIKFKRNHDGTWPDDVDAVDVGDLGTSTVKKIELLQVPGCLDFIITNGKDKHWISRNDGTAWDVLATV